MRTKIEKKIVEMRAEGLAYREIEEVTNTGNGNGTFAMRVCRKWGVA